MHVPLHFLVFVCVNVVILSLQHVREQNKFLSKYLFFQIILIRKKEVGVLLWRASSKKSAMCLSYIHYVKSCVC